jgi:hypothetical protein
MGGAETADSAGERHRRLSVAPPIEQRGPYASRASGGATATARISLKLHAKVAALTFTD